jgi:hypothetical protein
VRLEAQVLDLDTLRRGVDLQFAVLAAGGQRPAAADWPEFQQHCCAGVLTMTTTVPKMSLQNASMCHQMVWGPEEARNTVAAGRRMYAVKLRPSDATQLK